MDAMKIVIYSCGLYSLAFACFHIGFWKIFKWKSELKKISFANKAIIQILNVQIIYYLFFVTFLCFAFPEELMNSKLGNILLGATSIFWFIRTIQQFIFLRARHYKIHILTIIFLVGTILFALPLLMH